MLDNNGAVALLNGRLHYWDRAFCRQSSAWFQQLRADVPWQEEWLNFFGRRVKVPRLLAWYGDPGAEYSYSGVDHKPLPWSPLLNDICRAVSQFCGGSFNSALLNLYRSGQDAMGWHSDNEPELGHCPEIASLSLGAERYFELRQGRRGGAEFRLALRDGSLLLMRGDLQHHWQHRLCRQPGIAAERINITFRTIVSAAASALHPGR